LGTLRRPFLVYALVAAVLIAAVGLTYYSYRNTPSERLVVLDTMRELAREKVIGIQTEIMKAETDMFQRVDPDSPGDLQRALKESPLRTVLVLDLDRTIMPSGLYTKRPGEEEEIRRFFLDVVVPDLDLEGVLLDQRQNLHVTYDGLPHLFACTRRMVKGKMFFVVVEADLGHLFERILPGFFDVRGRHLYQIVDGSGELVYGYAFAGIPEQDAVQLPLRDTLSQWSLRVAPRDARLLASRASRRATLDLVLIGLATAVILAGFLVMLFAVRRERRVSELKSEFISNVSHELKTPLSIISMFGELLAMGRTRSPDQATEYAEIIRRESVRLSRLIDSVLDFSKIERGVDVYEFADDQDLREVVERALELSRHRLDRAGMELEMELDDDLPLARLDPNAITVAVLNLVDNAIKYAPDGKLLRVRLGRGRDGLELVVSDLGPGVAEDERAAIFERFYRSRTVRLKPIRGSGIGLALVRHIAEAHGGQVSVAAGEGGRGAAFRLWIPAGGTD
jgi:two-component system, OmpR family, phosphate regulon sensor histidine kinase PhoR